MKTLKEFEDEYRKLYPNKSEKTIKNLAQKAFDQQQSVGAQGAEFPTFPTIGDGTTGADTDTKARGIPVGFGLTDKNGDTLYLPPSRFPSYMQELLLTDVGTYGRIQNAVYESSNKKFSDPEDLGNYLKGLALNQQNVVRQNKELANIDIEKILNVGKTYRASNPLFAKNAGKNVPTDFPTISGETSAQNLITDVWKKELGREPTAEELTKYTKKLQKAQEKNPTKQTYEMVNGKRIQKTIQGLDSDQYLRNQVRKLPEFSTKTAEAARIAESNKQISMQTLAKTAAANGLDLQASFGNSLQDWSNRIANGESIEIFKSLIRQTAKRGLPESVGKLLDQGVDLEAVYEPYKKIMASVLEMNPETITLSDPTLRGAIGQDKEMTLYDFQRQLRKDPRWQYTNNARQDVSNSALQVLRDFGFQG